MLNQRLVKEALKRDLLVEDVDNWRFDVLWVAREAIEAANPWDNEALFSVLLAGRTLDLCVVIDTTSGSALHILTAEEAQR